nr:helitron helicase-like domain-containing protein [Tanacetum cinerariifolium]
MFVADICFRCFDGYDVQVAHVQTIGDGGNVMTRSLIRSAEFVDVTTVPVSRILDRFRRMCLNTRRSDCVNTSGNPHRLVPHENETTYVGNAGANSPLVTPTPEHAFRPVVTQTSDSLGHMPYSSMVASLNHAYLCHLRTRSVTNSKEPIPTQVSQHDQVIMDNVSYIDLGDYNQQCWYCGCLFWYAERLKGSNFGERPEYHLCCGGGKIYMPKTPTPPLFIQQLLRNKHFMEHIRAYNYMFAMTSFGAKVDDSVNKGRGAYVFKVSGQIYHWIGSLCSEEGYEPRFLQLYIYETRDKIANRMQNFGGRHEQTLNPEIVEGLIHVLDEHNGLVRLFRTARDRCSTGEIPGLKIRLYNKAAFVDMVLKPRDGSGEGKKVSMNAYYNTSYTHGLKTFGLSLEVDTCFNREPRYMYNHYLDALAICRSLGNQHYFITFTCNVKWPKIKRYMASYPGLTLSDRADIVCKVFEKKVNDFIKFLKYEKPFGYVTTFLYTIEFQKRGLLHCHTLLCVGPGSKITDAHQIDNYISTEILDPVEDHTGYKVVTELIMHGPCRVVNPVQRAKHWYAMQDDIPAKVSEATSIPNYPVNTPELQHYILYELETILSGFGKSVKDFGLLLPLRRMLEDLKNKLLMEERNYKRDLLS